MGFLGSIKNFLGIGGIDVAVQCPQQIAKEGGGVAGQITLTSKSDQHVLTLEVGMFEEYTSGRGDDEETREFELGKIQVGAGFDMKAGESKVVPFQLPFTLVKSNADDLKERGGALGALGSAAKWANKEQSEYVVRADCDVKGTALDPSGKQTVHLV